MLNSNAHTESSAPLVKESNTDFEDFYIEPHEDVLKDFGLFSLVQSFLTKHQSSNDEDDTIINSPSMDVGNVTKDIGKTKITEPPDKVQLQSTRQIELHKIKDAVGYNEVSESKLQFVPQWVLNEAIQNELENYEKKKAFKRTNFRQVPRNSNIISSHHFFKVKADGPNNSLRLKCRLVPHGNKDVEKDNIRSDSSSAQFLAIRILLSLTTLFQFFISSVDFTAAYLQTGPLKRDIYMRPPRAFASSQYELWKIMKPAYGLVESGRLWQLHVEE